MNMMGTRPRSCRRSTTSRLCWLILLVTIGVHGQPSNALQLNDKPPSADPIDVTISDDDVALLTLSSPGASGVSEVTLQLSAFHDDRGQVVKIGFEQGASSAEVPQTTKQLSLNKWADLRLDASATVLGRAYTGRLAVTAASAATENFLLRLSRTQPNVYQIVPAGGKDVPVNVPADGLTLVQIDLGSERSIGESAIFELSTFVSQVDGSIAYVQLKSADDTRVTQLELQIDKPLLNLALDASEIGFGAEYAGKLNISIAGQLLPPTTLKLTRIALTGDAELIVGQPPPVAITCWRLTCTPQPITVEIREASGRRPLIGITVSTVNGEPGTGGVNAPQDLAVGLRRPKAMFSDDSVGNGNVQGGPCGQPQSTVDLWRLNPQVSASLARQTLPPASQAKICIRFQKAFGPGSYSIPLQFRALNVEASKISKLLISIAIKRAALYPLLILVMGVLISYVSTKIIRTQLDRIQLEERITAIEQAPWFRQNRSILPVVRMKTELDKVNKALGYSRFFKYFYFPASLKGNVTHIEARLPHLQRLCQLFDYWDKFDDEIVRNRGRKKLRQAVEAFIATPLSTELDASVITELSNLEEWQDRSKLVNHYWLCLKGDILDLLDQVRLADFNAYDFTDSEAKLKATLELSKHENALKEVGEVVKALRQSPRQSDTPGFARAMQKVADALGRVQPDQLRHIIAAFEAINEALFAIDQHGPIPALEAIKAARATIENSALHAEWPTIEQLYAEVQGQSSRRSTTMNTKLLSALENVRSWDPDGLISTLDQLTLHFEESKSCERQIVRALLVALRPDDQPKNLGEARERENIYARLKAIWGTRKVGPRTKLLEASLRDRPLSELFTILDDFVWSGLDGKMVIKTNGKQPGAFDLIDFHVQAKSDPWFMDTYLFKHGLKYKWSITYNPNAHEDIEKGNWLRRISNRLRRISKWWRRISNWWRRIRVAETEDATQELAVTTSEPHVTQSIPEQAIDVHATVTVEYGTKSSTAHLETPFQVGQARVFSVVSAFQRVELAALVIAVVGAITTGMQTQQYQAALEGSLSTYWLLFAWGFGADQVKNLLEHMRTLMGATGD